MLIYIMIGSLDMPFWKADRYELIYLKMDDDESALFKADLDSDFQIILTPNSRRKPKVWL